MVITAREIIALDPGLDEEALRLGMSGNLCRCTGFSGIVSAIKEVADRRRVGYRKYRGDASGNPPEIRCRQTVGNRLDGALRYSPVRPVFRVPEIVSVSTDGHEVEGRIRTQARAYQRGIFGQGGHHARRCNSLRKGGGGGADKNSASRVKITLDYATAPSNGGKSTTTDIVANVVLTGPRSTWEKCADERHRDRHDR